MVAKWLGVLALMSLVDIVIPVPILGGYLIYVILTKPPWFRVSVETLYEDG